MKSILVECVLAAMVLITPLAPVHAYILHQGANGPVPPVPMILDGKDHDMNRVLLRIIPG